MEESFPIMIYPVVLKGFLLELEHQFAMFIFHSLVKGSLTFYPILFQTQFSSRGVTICLLFGGCWIPVIRALSCLRYMCKLWKHICRSPFMLSPEAILNYFCNGVDISFKNILSLLNVL